MGDSGYSFIEREKVDGIEIMGDVELRWEKKCERKGYEYTIRDIPVSKIEKWLCGLGMQEVFTWWRGANSNNCKYTLMIT